MKSATPPTLSRVEKPPGYAAFAPLLKDKTSEELFADAKALQELVDHPGWPVLTGLAEARTDFLVKQMRHGPILDQAQYVKLNAMVSGIEQALHAPLSVLFAAER